MTISATRRFIDIIGKERLVKGAWQTEPCKVPYRVNGAMMTGKENYIMSILLPRETFPNPYLPGSVFDSAYRSGCAIERDDLADVVQRCRR